MDYIRKNVLIKNLLRNMNESGKRKEETIQKELERAKYEPDVKELLKFLYLDENRVESFHRFYESAEFKSTFEEIARHVGYNWNVKICEIGAGNGFLSVALAKSGFRNVSILEPNSEWISGTGFISEMAKELGVHIWNDLDSWYQANDLYDLIITKACVHHFSNVSKVAAEVRCKIHRAGKWIVMDEFFAYSPKHLYYQLINHPHIYKYGQYEWPYSASMYIEFFESVGYKLKEIIPAGYKNNHIVRNVSVNFKHSKYITPLGKILIKLKLTIVAFKLENFIFGCLGNPVRFRLFTFPQVLVFELKELELPDIPN